MKRLYLGLALHNHQPVGNFPWVFEEAYQSAYLPMIVALEQHPSVRLALHYSGPLLDWIRANHPELLERIRTLVARGQVEMMGGGYYEPILPAIPDEDKLGQIRKMTASVKEDFHYEAQGLWLAERVWEPHLPKNLNEAGVRWTLVDDTHFRMVGLDEEALFGYYITEEQGRKLAIYPSSKRMRYLIPWRSVREVIEYFRDAATEDGTRIAIMGDDGEKFGSWPTSYELCWRRGWIEEFFRAIEVNSEWLIPIHLGDYQERFPSLGRIYLPCASYEEMLQWALPAEKGRQFTDISHALEAEGRMDITQFLRGGFWRYFMVKYPEINLMHKKMLLVHDKVYQAGGAGLNELWMGQCNCPYWHGVFGGIYMTDVRAATYQHLLQAEDEADAVLHPGGHWLSYRWHDLDCDGTDELLIEGDSQSLYLDPVRGGTICEWDIRRHHFNLAATIARRPEAYHAALTREETANESEGTRSIHDEVRAKAPDLQKHLYYDPYPRFCSVDHLVPEETTLSDFYSATYQELGDFADKPYQASVHGELKATLSRDGRVSQGDASVPLRLEKELALSAGVEGFTVRYTVTNNGPSPVRALFATEWNINLLGGGRNPFAYFDVPGAVLEDARLDSMGELIGVQRLVMGNSGLGVKLSASLSRAAKVWRFPVETVSSSEGGLEKVYQGSCVVFVLPCNLDSGESLSFTIDWAVD